MARKRRVTAATRGSYGQYTARQRWKALEDAEKLGIRAAAIGHGIPLSTLGNWA